MTLEDYIAKYGEKNGTLRWKKSDYFKRYRQTHREEKAEYMKQYHQEHRKEHLEYNRQYYKDRHKELLEYKKSYYQEQREQILTYKKLRRQTPYGRAHHLVNAYTIADKKHHRGECTLTAQWIMDNIFSKRCLYCGEDDWAKLGVDRIDNNKPHTAENCVCCCGKCNKKRSKMEFLKFAYSMGAKDSEGLVIQY